MNARERNANEEEGLTNEALERKEGEEGDAAVSGIFYLVAGANVPAEASSEDRVISLRRERCASDSLIFVFSSPSAK